MRINFREVMLKQGFQEGSKEGREESRQELARVIELLKQNIHFDDICKEVDLSFDMKQIFHDLLANSPKESMRALIKPR